MPTPDLFPETIVKKSRRVLAHMVDAGDGVKDYPFGAEFECRKCGWNSGWRCFTTASAIRRGVTCENCNQVKQSEAGHG